MKFSLKPIFELFKPRIKNSIEIDETFVLEKTLDFYYTNIINSLILFTYDASKLEEMETILIDPLTELYEEIQYAFTPICFEALFLNKMIKDELKNELLTFKEEVDNIPNEIWDWEFIDKHELWKRTRKNANVLLEIIGISSKDYNDFYTKIIYVN